MRHLCENPSLRAPGDGRVDREGDRAAGRGADRTVDYLTGYVAAVSGGPRTDGTAHRRRTAEE
ncbi:hypothetical protein EB74_12905 [Mycobacterium sp. SWH-M5]|nr:hypothetical protein EB74_12905 [Mycobacterium sp. SWH-M5]PJK21043.1 hypothetical protein CSX11_17240 [Mycolicibacterium goodii]